MQCFIKKFAFRVLVISWFVTAGAGLAILHAAPPPMASLGPQNLMLALVNHDRSQAGLAPLVWDDKLAQAASDHAHLMADQGELSHQFPGEPDLGARLAAQDVRMGRAGENVVYDENLESAHETFMNSPDHRDNILDPEYNAIGIGVVTADGVLYITEDFAHRVLDASDEKIAQVIAGAFKSAWKDAGNPDLPLASDPRLRSLARSMAQAGILPDAGRIMTLPGVAYAATFAVSDPEDLPISISRLKTEHKLNHYSVGVYFARTPMFPTGLYWVTIAVSYLPEVRMGMRTQFQQGQQATVKRMLATANQ